MTSITAQVSVELKGRLLILVQLVRLAYEIEGRA